MSASEAFGQKQLEKSARVRAVSVLVDKEDGADSCTAAQHSVERASSC
jgi:hypothetical protein